MQYLINIYYVSGTLLGYRNMLVNKDPIHMELIAKKQRIKNKF